MLKATIFCYNATEVINKLTRLGIWLLELRWSPRESGWDGLNKKRPATGALLKSYYKKNIASTIVISAGAPWIHRIRLATVRAP